MRVVNHKRTNLADLLLSKCNSDSLFTTLHEHQVFQGHTRFATSSISNLDGTHPHQWLPCTLQPYWTWSEAEARFKAKDRLCEGFITHNGDLDFFSANGRTYSLDELQLLLPALLHEPLPSQVDSCCVAGLLDLYRTKGLWLASLRNGYFLGALRGSDVSVMRLCGEGRLWSLPMLKKACAIFEAEFASFQRSEMAEPTSTAMMTVFAARMCNLLTPRSISDFELMPDQMATVVEERLTAEGDVRACIEFETIQRPRSGENSVQMAFGLCRSSHAA